MPKKEVAPPCLTEVLHRADGTGLHDLDRATTQSLADMALTHVGVSRHDFQCPQETCHGIGRMVVLPWHQVQQWPKCVPGQPAS